MIGLSWLLSNPDKNGNDQKGLSLACSSLGYRNRRSVQSLPSEAIKQGFETLHTRCTPDVPHHALANADVQAGAEPGGAGVGSAPLTSVERLCQNDYIFFFFVLRLQF